MSRDDRTRSTDPNKGKRDAANHPKQHRHKERPCGQNIPSAPTGLVLDLDERVEGNRHNRFNAHIHFNEVVTTQLGTDVTCDRYMVDFQHSADGVDTTQKARKILIHAKDEDADTVVYHKIHTLRVRHYYRFRARGIGQGSSGDSCRGAWSAWTGWTHVGPNAQDPPASVTITNPAGRRLMVKWTPPVEDKDLARYKIEIYQGANLKETLWHGRGARQYRYTVPKADLGLSHTAKVYAEDDDGTLSGATTSNALSPGDDAGHVSGEVSHHAGPNLPSGALRTDGASYATAAYPDLFAAIGYTHGGTGANFNVPDVKNRHLVSVGTAFALGANDGITETSRDQEHDMHGSHAYHGAHDAHTNHSQHSYDSVGEGSHAHSYSDNTAGPSTTQNAGTQAQQAAGPAHTHSIGGWVSAGQNHWHTHAPGHDWTSGYGHYDHSGHGQHAEHYSYEHDSDTARGHKKHHKIALYAIIWT